MKDKNLRKIKSLKEVATILETLNENQILSIEFARNEGEENAKD